MFRNMSIDVAHQTIQGIAIAVLWSGAPVVVVVHLERGPQFTTERVERSSVSDANVLDRIPWVDPECAVRERTPVFIATIEMKLRPAQRAGVRFVAVLAQGRLQWSVRGKRLPPTRCSCAEHA